MHNMLHQLRDIADVRTAHPLAPLTSFKIGGEATCFVVPKAAYVPQVMEAMRASGLPLLILGNGSNLLVSDEGFRGVVVKLPAADELSIDGTHIVCPAGISLSRVCVTAREHALTGLEFAYGIPGTVGGALYMNAGAYGGAMADVVESAQVLDEDGALYTISAAEMELGYRYSVFMQRNDVIVSVTLRLREGDKAEISARMGEYTQRRREKQPLEFPSAGSYFKRPPQEGVYAGALIEQCGLKGYHIGGAAVSEKHAGFVVNLGGATCADVLRLEEEVRERVFTLTGVLLQREVRYVGG